MTKKFRTAVNLQGYIFCARRVTNVSGNANNGANDGFFYLNANYASSNLYRNISAQLCLTKIRERIYDRYLLVKNEDCLTMCW